MFKICGLRSETILESHAFAAADDSEKPSLHPGKANWGQTRNQIEFTMTLHAHFDFGQNFTATGKQTTNSFRTGGCSCHARCSYTILITWLRLLGYHAPTGPPRSKAACIIGWCSQMSRGCFGLSKTNHNIRIKHNTQNQPHSTCKQCANTSTFNLSWLGLQQIKEKNKT